jgi:hypothetical protein
MPPERNNQPWLRPLSLLILVLVMGALSYHLGYRHPRGSSAVFVPDTIRIAQRYVDTIYVPKPTPPRYVRIYLPDTARRQRIEADTLIAGIRLRPDSLQVERITPRGSVLISVYPLRTRPEIDVTATCNVAIKDEPHKRPRKPRRLVWLAAGLAIGAVLVLGR